MHEEKVFTSQERKGRMGSNLVAFQKTKPKKPTKPKKKTKPKTQNKTNKQKKPKKPTHHHETPHLEKASEKVTTQGLVHPTA